MRVLIACERFGVVRRAFASRGHYAVSVDLAAAEDDAPWGSPYSGIGQHYEGDVFDFLRMGETGEMPGSWDLVIAHPECTYLSSSGLHWNKRRPRREQLTEAALAFGLKLWALPVGKLALENPRGRLTKVLREGGAYIQTIQPFQYGADASKATCLALKGLPPLRPTAFSEPRAVNPVGTDIFGTPHGTPRWKNQTNSGQNRLTPSPQRAMERARTYPGIAEAMAEQWGATA